MVDYRRRSEASVEEHVMDRSGEGVDSIPMTMQRGEEKATIDEDF